jgi:glycine C-acetyltransferase
MNDLSKRMRHRRFQIKPDADIVFTIETSTGSRFELKLDNVSLSGLAARTEQAIDLSEEGLELGSIIPAAKIAFKGHEYALGRLVLRSNIPQEKGMLIGFSTVDSKVPVDGDLSQYFAQEFDDAHSVYEFELSPDKFSMANFAEGQSTNVDLFNKVHQFSVFMKDWSKTPKFSYKNVRLPSMGHRIRLSKKRRNGREDYIIMGSNDYLGLASHPEVLAAAKKAIDDYGFGSTGSPLTTGVTEAHLELSDFLAKMLQKEKVILFNSGYAANVGIISGLLQTQDMVVADMLAHASIQDAMQMCRGTSRFFKHNSVEHLDKVLRENRDQYSGCLVVTEGVFSMDGDVAPIDEVIRVAQKNKARVMVDEAHSFGVIGQTGLGACEKYGVMEQADVIMGTFSKICGGIGGFAATTEEVADWLYFWARAHMFSVSIPPSTAAAALKALQIFRENRSLLMNLRANVQHFKAGLASLGYRLPSDHESAVVPVIVGDEKKLQIMNQILMEAGVFVIPIVYPAVGRKNCRFRFTVMATHSISDLDYVLNVLELAMEKAQFKFEDVSSATNKKNAA